jgi:hypothetical protein
MSRARRDVWTRHWPTAFPPHCHMMTFLKVFALKQIVVGCGDWHVSWFHGCALLEREAVKQSGSDATLFGKGSRQNQIVSLPPFPADP